MNRLALFFALIVVISPIWGAVPEGGPAAVNATDSNTPPQAAPTLKEELEKLKQQVAALEERLKAQDQQAAPVPGAKPQEPAAAEVASTLKELDQRVSQTERNQALDRIHFTGDYRFEAHGISAKVPAHFDGMKLQNLLVKTMFATPILGRPPASVTEINNTVSSHYADYLQFTNNLTFDRLKQGMASFPASMQQQLFGMLMPSTFTPAYQDNNSALFTNRLRLNFDARVADNVSFTGRLSMYKVFGDSTGVQVFNGQPNTLNIDGTTAGVPNSRPVARGARLLQLEQHRRVQDVPFDRPPPLHRRPADELPAGRTARRHALGLADRLTSSMASPWATSWATT